MYLPRHFEEHDAERIDALIRDYGFATLISVQENEAVVSVAPLQWNRAAGTLSGHLAKANPHSVLLRDDHAVTVLIHGPHGYVSPTWYREENPRAPNVPTWNYALVELRGRASAIDDNEAKWRLVQALAAQYERGPGAWDAGAMLSHAPKLEAIACFTIAVDTVAAKLKLSQNRSAADQQAVIERLERASHPDGEAMAALMRQNLARRSG